MCLYVCACVCVCVCVCVCACVLYVRTSKNAHMHSDRDVCGVRRKERGLPVFAVGIQGNFEVLQWV